MPAAVTPYVNKFDLLLVGALYAKFGTLGPKSCPALFKIVIAQLTHGVKTQLIWQSNTSLIAKSTSYNPLGIV